MAELVASIIGIVSAGTKVAFVLSQLANDIGSAGREARIVAMEIRGSCAVLTTLQDVLSRVQTSDYFAHCADVTNDMTNTSLEMFAEIIDVIEGLHLASDISESKLNVRRRLQWVFQKPKILMLRAALDAYRSNLALMLGTLDIAEKTTRSLGHEITKAVIEEEEQDFKRLNELQKDHRTSIIRLQEIEYRVSQSKESEIQDSSMIEDTRVWSEITVKDASPSSPATSNENSFLPQAEAIVSDLRNELEKLRSSRTSFQTSTPDNIRARVSQYENRLSQLVESDQARISGRWSRALSIAQMQALEEAPKLPVLPKTHQALNLLDSPTLPAADLEVPAKSSPLSSFIHWMDAANRERRRTTLDWIYTKYEPELLAQKSGNRTRQLLQQKNILELKIARLERQLSQSSNSLDSSTLSKPSSPSEPGLNPFEDPDLLSSNLASTDHYLYQSDTSGIKIGINNAAPRQGGRVSPGSVGLDDPSFTRYPVNRNLGTSSINTDSGSLKPPSPGRTPRNAKRQSGLWSPGSSVDARSTNTPPRPRSPALPQIDEQDNEKKPISPSGSPTPAPDDTFKSFRVSIDDPVYKVLPAALQKYNITTDWQQYALYIVYGDQERCLGREERPLILFKQLDKEGKKPMFMLRKHAAPVHGFIQQKGIENIAGSTSLSTMF
ncbi:RA-domain-containing protein [Tothia fuscella]|uniref:RA-domain-containing protein n=1 Tax=Tothia fuscella TaxID=1048955 RepID=A0A9P4U0U1_9PEZI|nr:RA-domain-containing protein [Tothia fuscella]